MKIAVMALPFLLVAALVQEPADGAPRLGEDLGTIEPIDAEDPACPDDHACLAFTVTCPALRPLTAFFAIHEANDSRGVVVLHDGARGNSYWAKTSEATDALGELWEANLSTVQMRWVGGWSRPGAQGSPPAGPDGLACRPATAIQWAYENVYVAPAPRWTTDGTAGAPNGAVHPAAPAFSPPANGTAGKQTNLTCGFCYAGTSAGALAGAYAMARYGLDDLFDRVVFASGPPVTNLTAACLESDGVQHLEFGRRGSRHIDHFYGFSRNGPCQTNAESWRPTWTNDSLDAPGGDWTHTAPVRVIVGGADRTGAVEHALYYADMLEGNGTAVTVEVVEGMRHVLHTSEDGLARVVEALTR